MDEFGGRQGSDKDWIEGGRREEAVECLVDYYGAQFTVAVPKLLVSKKLE